MTENIHLLNLDTGEDVRFLDRVRREQRYFDDPEDTALLWHGVHRAAQIAAERGISRRLLDMCSGVSLVVSPALVEGLLDSARAIDVNEGAVKRGQELAIELGVYEDRERYEILSADIETENARRLAQAFEPTIIAGNLPYLPQRLSTPDSTRDAGSDGLRFIEILLSYSRMPSVQLATLNMCSMTTPQKALELFSANDLAIDTAYVFKTTFGYRTRLLFEQGVIDESRGHYFHVAADGTPYQVMMNLVMSRGGLRKDGVGSEQIMAMLSHFSRTGEVVKGLGQVRRPLS